MISQLKIAESVILEIGVQDNDSWIVLKDIESKEELECSYWDKEELLGQGASNVLGACMGSISCFSKNICIDNNILVKINNDTFICFPCFEAEPEMSNFKFVQGTPTNFIVIKEYTSNDFSKNPHTQLIDLGSFIHNNFNIKSDELDEIKKLTPSLDKLNITAVHFHTSILCDEGDEVKLYHGLKENRLVVIELFDDNSVAISYKENFDLIYEGLLEDISS